MQIPLRRPSEREADNDSRILKHLLFYRIRGAEVLVLRIVHGARDLEKLF